MTEQPSFSPDAGRCNQAEAWFSELRDRICAEFEAIEERIRRRMPRGAAAGPFRAPRLAAAGRRRRDDLRYARAGFRKGRGQHFDRVGRILARVPQRDPGRVAGSPLLGERHLARRPYVLAARPGGAYEHPPYRHQQSLVRRRRRSDPDLPRRGRGTGVSCRACGRLRILRRRLLRALQDMVRRILLSQASGRAARRRRDLLRLSRQRRPGARLRLRPLGRRRPSSASSRPLCGRGCSSPGPRSNGAISWSAAAAMSSSTSSTTGAPCSD